MNAPAHFLTQSQVLALVPRRALALRVLLQIGADAECTSFTGKNYDPNRVIAFGSAERLGRFTIELLADRVEAVRAIEAYLGQSVARVRADDGFVCRCRHE